MLKIALLAAFAFLLLPTGVYAHAHPTTEPAAASSVAEPASQRWTCSMHPNIKRSGPGKCPICEMDLIPLDASGVSDDPDRPVQRLSPYAEKLAEVATCRVERKAVPRIVFLSGKIDYDESRLSKITAHYPGRVEKLFVNYTGIRVRKGDHIAEIFSPDLAVMQREFFQTLAEARKSHPGEPLAAPAMLPVLSKMRAWGFSREQIAALVERGAIEENLTVLSPIDGVVIEKNIAAGEYFQKENVLFTIADLSRVWLILDAYETDLAFLRYGQEVAFQVEAWPGEVFKGRISYVHPLLDAATRTVPIRVNVENPAGKLKPGMYVRAEVSSHVGGDGRDYDAALAGKWISPMHPEIVKDEPGACDECGMALVPAETLGLAADPAGDAPLVIPVSAPLITGRRAVVYVRTGPGHYEGRQVMLGARRGEFYEVLSGLEEGEEVVTRGNMKIDGALQIAGARSMTSPLNFDSARQISPLFRQNLQQVMRHYFTLQKQMAADVEEIGPAYREMRAAIAAIPAEGSPDDWTKRRNELLGLLPEEGITLAGFRVILKPFTAALDQAATEYRLNTEAFPYKRYYCSMALDYQGGYWFQDEGPLANPYFGKSMLRCGMEK